MTGPSAQADALENEIPHLAGSIAPDFMKPCQKAKGPEADNVGPAG